MNFLGPLTQQKLKRLDQNLPSTIYGSDKQLVREHVYDLLTTYDSMDFRIISHISDPASKVFEIYGNIPIIYQGSTFLIILSIIFPPKFPNTSPVVTLVNPDVTRFKALPKYEKARNPDGKSYPLAFSEVTNWGSHKNILKVMSQICSEFGKEYPLFEVTNPFMNKGYGGYASAENYGQASNGFNFSVTERRSYSNINDGKENEQYIAQIKKKYFNEALGIAKKMETDLNFQRTSLIEIQSMWLKLIDEDEKITKFENDAPLLIQDFYNKKTILEDFVQSNQATKLTGDNLPFVVSEADEKSRSLMDLITSNKALEDVNMLLENMFRSGSISTEDLMKNYKENCEKEFYNKHLIKKLTTL